MTDPTPDPQPAGEEPSVMPRWVPVLIGAVLVALAALAVFTGLRYREDNALTRQVRPRTTRATAPAPTGEPGAGASLVLHGESGENTPAANAPVKGQARAVISGGGAAGINTTVRIWAKRGMVFNVLPEDTMVYVNDLPIGEVNQFNTLDEVYDFAEPGSYTVKLVAPNGKTKTYVVTAADDAKAEVARISERF